MKRIPSGSPKTILSSHEAEKQVFFGVVDSFAGGELSGWVYNRTATLQNISVLLNSTELFTVRAILERPDVEEAGLGIGPCGFKFNLDLRKIPKGDHLIEIVDSASSAPLRNGIFVANRMGMRNVASKDEVVTKQNRLTVHEFLDLFQRSQKEVSPSVIADALLDCTNELKRDEFVTACYCLILGRTPDLAGYRTAQRASLETREERRTYITAMLSSREFIEHRSLPELEGTIRRSASALKYLASIKSR